MSTIFISKETGGHTPHSEFQARYLWKQGMISPRAHYWMEGMRDWRPVSEFFEAGMAAPEVLRVLPSPPPRPRGFAKDPQVLTQFVIVMLWISLAGAAVAAGLGAVPLATGDAKHANDNELTLIGGFEVLVGLGQLVIFIVTGVGFLKWMHRANFNARGLGAKGMNYTPGWCVGWFFIPIACLWKPFGAMKEIWQASRNPQAWFSEPPSGLLGIWWALWIVSNILGQMAWRASAIGPEAAVATGVLSDVVSIPLCLVAIKLIKQIYEMQRGWAEKPLTP